MQVPCLHSYSNSGQFLSVFHNKSNSSKTENSFHYFLLFGPHLTVHSGITFWGLRARKHEVPGVKL